MRQQPAFTVKPGTKLIHVQKNPVRFATNGKGWEYETHRFEVKVLAVAGIWAMVRRGGGMPFVSHINDLESLAAERIGGE